MIRRIPISAIVVCALIHLSYAAETFSARCVGVHDGDTITVLRDRREVKIRLEGIDSPELGQDFGTRAKQFTSQLVFGKTVTVALKYFDRHHRAVARVKVKGQDVSTALVAAGLAWDYKRYSSDPVLAQAQELAKAAKKGLWSRRNPTPPWAWRQQKRRR